MQVRRSGKMDPEPTLEETLQRLGTPEEVFRPSLANLVAGYIIGALLAFGGAATVVAVLHQSVLGGKDMPLWPKDKEPSWFALGIFFLLGLGLLAGAWFLVNWVRGLFSFRVLFCRDGFAQVYRDKVDTCRWDEVEHVEERVIQEHFPLKGPARHAVPMGKSRHYFVRRRDGVEFGFDGNSVKRIGRLGKLLQQHASEHDIPWEVVHLSD
jgi:hypothetical protein